MKLGKFELDKIYLGDCRDLTKQLPNNSIDMSITSPPYWGGLRDYGKETEVIWDGEENREHEWGEDLPFAGQKAGNKVPTGFEQKRPDSAISQLARRNPTAGNFCAKCGAWKGQLGLEPNFNLYIKHLCDIFDEVKRVLKKEGTCWVNIGDTYSAGGGAGSGEYRKRHTQFGKIMESKSQSLQHKTKDYPTKSLVMIPFRFAIEMVNRGWILRNTIIWHKPNCMPSSVKDRFTVDFEYLFFFSKSKKYYFEQQFEKYKDINTMIKYYSKSPEQQARMLKRRNTKFQKVLTGSTKLTQVAKDYKVEMKPLEGRNKRAVWKIGSKYNQAEGHSNRAGLQREPTLREKRINEIIQKEIANYLRKYIIKENKNILDKEFGEHKWPHWIRTDESGASLPSPNDWLKLKEILNFDNKYDDIMTETEIYLDDGMMWKDKEKNKRAVWTITTRAFKEAHFAVFPPKLIETPIKAGCPEFVCKKCGKAKIKIYKVIGKKKVPPIGGIKHQANINPTYSGNTEQQVKKELGYKALCDCNAGFDSGIVLDPFIGSGTIGEVAIKQRKHFIGFEINPEYVEMANRGLENVQVSML